jgi:hypothetical protein
MPIQTSIRVRGSSSQRPFTLGPLIAHEGFWFAFAPIYAVTADEAIFDETHARQVGVVSNVDVETKPDRYEHYDIASILRPILIDRADKAVVGRSSRLVDPIYHLGEPVWKTGASGRTKGTISGIDGTFHIRQSDGGIGRYHGAMDIEGDEFAEFGDAGSSIVTNDGGLLGVLVGVAAERYYCVPGTAIRDRFFPISKAPRILV